MRRCPTCQNELDDDSRFCPYDGTPVAHLSQPRSSADPRLGMWVDGRYRIEQTLGKGGMAAVYRAHAPALAQDVALKLLHGELTTRQRSVARFARESRAASRIDHPNVVRIFDFGYAADQGFYFLIMELLEGRSLHRVIQETGALDVARAVHVLAQIAAGLSRAHALGVVHRDLKPENVMLVSRSGSDDFVKIVDFGMARVVSTSEGQLTRAGDVLGTPHFMAPEQWAGGAVDHRADIYAFGGVAFELLTGELPYPGRQVQQLMFAHLTQPVPRVRALRPEVPEPLAALVERCLAKEPDERFGSFDEVLARFPEIWPHVPAPSIRVSYGSSPAAPPRRATDGPTLLEASAVVHPDQAALVVEEIQRLRRLRQRRLSELAAMIWGAAPPPEVARLQREIITRESRLAEGAQALALAEAELAAAEERFAAGEADLRLQLVEANLRRAGMEDEGFALEPTRLAAPVTTAVRDAESALAALRRDRERELGRLRSVLGMRLGQLAEREAELGPHYEALARHVHAAAARRPDLRPHVEAFGQVDGAIVAQQQLLARLDAKRERIRT